MGDWTNMLNELLDLDEGLTDWEVNFIESLDRQTDDGSTPSDRQRNKLESIWKERIG